MTKAKSRFDTEALRELVGEKVFARGQAYHRGGQVEILSMEKSRVVAQVSGSEDYRTVVTGSGQRIGGECSCRAFEEWGYCKHMVAAALAANGTGEDAVVEGAGTLTRIRGHLKQKGLDALVEMIVDLAERDAALYRKLEMAAAATGTDERTVEASLRKAIDKAARTGGFVEYRAVREWAAGVDEVLDGVEALVATGRGGLALKLADHALRKIEVATGHIDDSDGYCGGLLHRAAEIHLAACGAARPDPVKLAREIFTREMAEVYDTFDGAIAAYADILGETGLAEYRRLATEAWDKLPPRGVGKRARQEYEAGYDRLKAMLDFFAERDGDVDARVALRAKDLSAQWSYLQLAEFCLSQGREQEALARAEEGLWIFEDQRPDERLVGFAVKLLVKGKRKSDAEVLLWRVFEKGPSLELYRQLKKIGGDAARDRAIAFLDARAAREKPSQWHFHATLLIQVLMEEKMFDHAWRIAKRHGASPEFAEDLAKASEASHPGEAIEVYAQRVEQMVSVGNGYEEASRLIARMKRLRGAAEQAAYVEGLKARHGRKRNFMKLLG